MAQKKLLFLLTMLAATFYNSSIFAEDNNHNLIDELSNVEISQETLDWANSARNQAMELTRNNLIEKFKQLKIDQGRANEITDIIDPAATLRVFVSSSMPEPLLRQYHRQAAKYGGTLVFRGLPNSSFKELARIVTAISEEGEVGAIQLDDESFTRFSVNAVPTIVLAKEEDCMFNQNCKVTYDKAVGNIGIKSVLEKFASDGDLSVEAQELLEQ